MAPKLGFGQVRNPNPFPYVESLFSQHLLSLDLLQGESLQLEPLVLQRSLSSHNGCREIWWAVYDWRLCRRFQQVKSF